MPCSIWLTLPSEETRSLRLIIDRLAAKYGVPSFAPHLTLMGSIDKSEAEVTSVMSELCSLWKPFIFQPVEVSCSTTYFQNVFLRIAATAELLQANLDLKKAFGLENNVFMPHMSLMYGDQTPELRWNVAQSIGQEVMKVFTTAIAQTVAIIPFTPEMKPEDWQPIATYRLTN